MERKLRRKREGEGIKREETLDLTRKMKRMRRKKMRKPGQSEEITYVNNEAEIAHNLPSDSLQIQKVLQVRNE